MEGYLSEVRRQNWTYQGSVEQKIGSAGRRREADLLFSPSLYSSIQVKDDKKPSDLPVMSYDKIETRNYSVGISQLTRFGMSTKLYYAMDYSHYLMPDQPMSGYYAARPVLEITQPLWRNGFGRSDRSNEEAVKAQSESEAWNAESNRQNLLVDAEMAYWDLAIARELVQIQERSLHESDAIYEYVSRRARMNLTDQADVLQAKASLETKRLDLKAARDDEAVAKRAFNTYLNRSESEEAPVLSSVPWKEMPSIETTKQPQTRADVLAAEAQSKASVANARMLAEKDKPSLDLYFSHASNGWDSGTASAVSDSFSWNRPTTTAGLTFSIPLNYSAAKDALRGAQHEESAAQWTYRQKLLDQQQAWSDLLARLSDAKTRLELAFTIESAQKQKLDYEKQRLKEGRTTTYQVLLFEQDYSQAEYAKAKAAAQVLDLSARLKLYGHDASLFSKPNSKE